jgi:hypothetical protein
MFRMPKAIMIKVHPRTKIQFVRHLSQKMNGFLNNIGQTKIGNLKSRQMMIHNNECVTNITRLHSLSYRCIKTNFFAINGKERKYSYNIQVHLQTANC